MKQYNAQGRETICVLQVLNVPETALVCTGDRRRRAYHRLVLGYHLMLGLALVTTSQEVRRASPRRAQKCVHRTWYHRLLASPHHR